MVLARVPAVLVDFANADLDGGVVLGLDDAVGRAALARDVAGRKQMLVYWSVYLNRRSLSPINPSPQRVVAKGTQVSLPCLLGLCGAGGGVVSYRSTISPLSFSILAVLCVVYSNERSVSVEGRLVL